MRAMLQPVVVLLGWTMVMWLWMYATRIPAMRKHTPDLMNGTGKGDLDARLPPSVQWKAHNYNHLMEQPTLFYAVVVVLAVVGVSDGPGLVLAWAYVGLRIAHSLWQALSNFVPLRFALFMLSSLCLVGLIAIAAREVFAAA